MTPAPVVEAVPEKAEAAPEVKAADIVTLTLIEAIAKNAKADAEGEFIRKLAEVMRVYLAPPYWSCQANSLPNQWPLSENYIKVEAACAILIAINVDNKLGIQIPTVLSGHIKKFCDAALVVGGELARMARASDPASTQLMTTIANVKRGVKV